MMVVMVRGWGKWSEVGQRHFWKYEVQHGNKVNNTALYTCNLLAG